MQKTVKEPKTEKPKQPGMRRLTEKSIMIGCVALACIVLLVLQARWVKDRKDDLIGKPIHQFARILDEQTSRIFCQQCQGTGLLQGSDAGSFLVCPVCFGVGMRQIRPVFRTDVICATCRGIGRLADEGNASSAHDCEACGGRGLEYIETDEVKIAVRKIFCPTCDGRGVLSSKENARGFVLCDICLGRGGNLLRELHVTDTLCAACEGMGRVIDEGLGAGRPCKRCNGRGLHGGDAP